MESWTSYMIEGTKIRLLNNTTKNIEDLTTDDELIVMNASDPSFDAANLEHNSKEGGFATNIIKKEFSLSDVVTIQLENGSEVTVTKDYPIVGANKSAGWQVFDIDIFIKTYLDTTYVTSTENRNELIYSLVSNVDHEHNGIHPQAKDWWDSSISGSMHPSGRQSGGVPGRLAVGKPIVVENTFLNNGKEKYSNISNIVEYDTDEKIDMYCIELVEYAHYNILNGIVCPTIELGHLWPRSFYDDRGIYHNWD
jgi:uncharacterized Zn ribbon protein